MNLLPHHRAHDVRALAAGWAAVARAAGLRRQVLARIDGLDVVWYESRRGSGPACYVSAGVHGDEPAAAWGLLAWAQANTAWLREQAVVLFPCLNPHGLALNTRTDGRGLDLNRRFHLQNDAVCGPWQQVAVSRPWRLALCLHEDYDGQGAYVYELGAHRESHSAALLAAATREIGIDPRRRIDHSMAREGIIRRRRLPTHLPGLPEAVALQQLGCPLTLTFETPSEFDLDARVRAQAAFIAAALAAFSA
jgi:predicted deacylase